MHRNTVANSPVSRHQYINLPLRARSAGENHGGIAVGPAADQRDISDASRRLSKSANWKRPKYVVEWGDLRNELRGAREAAIGPRGMLLTALMSPSTSSLRTRWINGSPRRWSPRMVL